MLSSSFPRFAGDYSGNFVLGLAKGLARKGHKVSVVAPHEDGISLHETMDGVRIHRFRYLRPSVLQRLAYGDGMVFNTRRTPLLVFQAPFFIIAELFSTIRLARTENVDVLNSHWLIPQGIVGAICKKIIGARHVATIHSSEVTLLKKIPAGRLITEFALRHSDAVVSVSQHRTQELSTFVRGSLWELVKERVTVLPMGVDSDSLGSIRDKAELKARHGIATKFVILFVGRLIEVKGCDGLIQAFGILRNRISDVQLVIVGSGAMLESIKRTASRLGLRDSIRFEGIVGHDCIGDYYALSDVVVVPSIIDTSNYQEGLPVVLLEAMALGKPVVATKTNGIMEIIRNHHNGILVEPLDSEAMADAILMLLNDTGLRETISENALNTGRRFSWDSITEKYADLIENRGEGKGT